MVLNSAPRFVVLGGAGAIGRIVVRDLFQSNRKNHIFVADYKRDAAFKTAGRYRSPRLLAGPADVRDIDSLVAILRGYSIVINCTRHQFNLGVMEAALRAGVHYIDLGGLFVWTRRRRGRHRRGSFLAGAR